MTMNHAVSELVCLLKNGQLAKKNKVVSSFSKMKQSILEILKKEGYIKDFEIINDAPLTMISRTRIDSKRLTFKEYYNNDLVEKFFTEQLDNSESAGFGLALCDLRLFNQTLEPHDHLKIYDENHKTHSKLILPIKKQFSLVVYNKY